MSGDAEGPGATIDYAALVRQAFLDLVRRLLARVSEEGLPGSHHFFLTFATTHEGVELPPRLRQKFPEEMTVVLQHQYWNLQVDDAGFAVTLRFEGAPERVVVPWPALRSFADPSVEFGLQLRPADVQAEAAPREPEPPAFASVETPAAGASSSDASPKPKSPGPKPSKPKSPAPDTPDDGGRCEARSPKVVDLGTFRRKPGGGATG